MSESDAVQRSYDPAWEVRVAAAAALGEWSTEASLDRLQELCLEDDQDVNEAAATQLLRHGRDGLERFLLTWNDSEPIPEAWMRNAFSELQLAGTNFDPVLVELETTGSTESVREIAHEFRAMVGYISYTELFERPTVTMSQPSGMAGNLSINDLGSATGELHEHLLRLTEERQVPQEVVGTSSGDERISLTLVGGRATELTIDARAMRQTNAELAEEVLEAINAALTAQSDGDGERAMSRLAGLGEVLERSRRQAEEQLAQVEQGLRDTAAARTEADARYRPRGDR